MSFPNGVRLSDSIASKIIEGGFPSDLDGLRFNAALNIWEFVPFGGGGGGTNHIGLLATDNSDPGSNTTFNGIMDARQVFDVNESRNQSTMPRASTFSRLGIRITGNLQVVDSNLRFRVNAVSVNLNVVIGAGLTGFFQDLVNTDAVVLGDEVAEQLTQDNAFNLDTRSTSVEYT